MGKVIWEKKINRLGNAYWFGYIEDGGTSRHFFKVRNLVMGVQDADAVVPLIASLLDEPFIPKPQSIKK